MPPQVQKSGPGAPVVQQAPPPEVPKDESKDVAKSTSSADTSAVKTQTAETKSGTSTQQKEPEDPKAAARQAQGSKQNAMDKQKEHKEQAQRTQNDLQKRVPASGSGYGWEDLGRDVGHATVSAAKTSKTEKATSPEKPAQQKKTGKPSEGNVWDSVKGAAQYTANVANAGVGVLRESLAVGAAAVAAEKAAQVERDKVIVKRGPAVLDGEIELAASGKSRFADVERAIGNLDAYNREAPGAEIKQLLLQKDESVKKLLGPYGYETVDYGQRFPEDRKITQTEVLDTALHNWRNTPLEARKAIHAGDYRNLPDNYKKNWQPVDRVKIAQQNRAAEGDQVVRNAPLPGDHGRSYEGPRRNQPDPGLVWAQAKKDFTDASFDVINSLGGGIEAKSPGSKSRATHPVNVFGQPVPSASTTGRSTTNAPKSKPSQMPDAPARPQQQWRDVNVANKQGTQTNIGNAKTQQNSEQAAKTSSSKPTEGPVKNKSPHAEKMKPAESTMPNVMRAQAPADRPRSVDEAQAREETRLQQRRLENALENLDRGTLENLTDGLRNEGTLSHVGTKEAQARRGWPGDGRPFLEEVREALIRSRDPKVTELLESNPAGLAVQGELHALHAQRERVKILRKDPPPMGEPPW